MGFSDFSLWRVTTHVSLPTLSPVFSYFCTRSVRHREHVEYDQHMEVIRFPEDHYRGSLQRRPLIDLSLHFKFILFSPIFVCLFVSVIWGGRWRVWRTGRRRTCRCSANESKILWTWMTNWVNWSRRSTSQGREMVAPLTETCRNDGGRKKYDRRTDVVTPVLIHSFNQPKNKNNCGGSGESGLNLGWRGVK